MEYIIDDVTDKQGQIVNCPVCPPDDNAVSLGKMGSFHHWRCRNCGIGFMTDITATPEPTFPAEVYDVLITVNKGFSAGIGEHSHVPTYTEIEFNQPIILTDEIHADHIRETFVTLFRELYRVSFTSPLSVSASFDFERPEDYEGNTWLEGKDYDLKAEQETGEIEEGGETEEGEPND